MVPTYLMFLISVAVLDYRRSIHQGATFSETLKLLRQLIESLRSDGNLRLVTTVENEHPPKCLTKSSKEQFPYFGSTVNLSLMPTNKTMGAVINS